MILKRIKVVFLVGQLGLGGSERQLYLLLKHFDRDLFECHIIVFNPSQYLTLDDSLEKMGVKVWSVPLKCKGVFRRIRFVYHIFQKVSPDIVHSWTVHDNPYAGVIGFLAGVPVRLGSLRGSLSLGGFQNLSPIYRFLSLKSVRWLMVNSKAILKELAENQYDTSRVILLPNCAEISSASSVNPDLSSLGIRNGHRIVGTVGNLRSVKNHLMFVEGMARVLPDFSDAFGLIIGQPIPYEPDLSNKIRAKIKELQLEGRVILAGFRPNIPELMHRMEVFCLTSQSESTPNVVLEAMAAARPVVATKVGGVPELIEDGVNGFLTEPNDVEGFARSVAYLLEHPDIGKKMGSAGRAKVEYHFRCEQASQQLKDLYLNLLVQKKIAVM